LPGANPPLPYTLALSSSSAFSIFNINVYSIPFDDIARFIAQRIRSNKKPSIDSIEAVM
jgi:hypothetical protein